MSRRRLLRTATLLPGAVPAAAALGQAAAEEGFTALFDGKTLGGWSVREGPESAFYVENGEIVGHASAEFPCWLRSDRQYENFDFRGEFFIRGWMDGGLYFHAPEHGRNSWTGMKVNIFHQQDKEMRPESVGSIFPLVPPLRVNVRNSGEWNTLRVLMDWPRLRVWMNEETVQDLDVESVPDLRHRLRRGYLGLETLSYPLRFRNLRIRELPSKERWETLYDGPQDFDKWMVTQGKPNVVPAGQVLWANGSGQLGTKEKYRDFELHLYVRGENHHNGGILFRGASEGRRPYEIQIHDVEEAHYPTGSLYGFKRAAYPRIEREKWFLIQLIAQGSHCLVRINGENVLEYEKLENLEEGHIQLQAHRPGRWLEHKHIRIKRL